MVVVTDLLLGRGPSVYSLAVISPLVAGTLVRRRATLVYAVLAVIEVKLFLTYVRRGAEPFEDPRDHADADEDAPLQFAY